MPKRFEISLIDRFPSLLRARFSLFASREFSRKSLRHRPFWPSICLDNDRPDIVYVTAHYRSRMIAHFNLSWMSPVKVRRVAIGGTKQMILWDDLNSEERVKIYNSGIETGPEEQRILYRIGDIFSPRLPTREALANVVEEFQRAIEGDKKSLIDGDAGRRVVRMLEAAQAALDRRFGTLASLNASADAVSF